MYARNLRSGAVIVSSMLLTLPALAGPPPTWTWDGGGDGTNWTDPLNWDSDSVPASAADTHVVIGPGETVIANGWDGTLFDLTCDGSLTLGPAGKFTFAAGGGGTIATFILDVGGGGSSEGIQGPGDVNVLVTNHFEWITGNIGNCCGQFGLTLEIGESATGLIPTSASNWRNLNSSHIINRGSMLMDSGLVVLQQNLGGPVPTIQNTGPCGVAGGGTWTMRNNSNLTCSPFQPIFHFTNDGCFIADGTGNAGRLNVVLLNYGDFAVEADTEFTIPFGGSCEAGSSMNVADGATLHMSGTYPEPNATFASAAGSSIYCAPGGMITHGGGYGTFRFIIAGDFNIDGTLMLDNGHFGVSGSDKTITDLQLLSTGQAVDGSALIRVTNSMEWTGGIISAQVQVEPGASLTFGPPTGGANPKTIGPTGHLTIAGSAISSAPDSIKFENGATMEVASTGTMEIAHDFVFENARLSPDIEFLVNHGQIIKSGPGTWDPLPRLDNYGVLDIQEGVVSCSFGTMYQHAGGETVLHAGTTLELDAPSNNPFFMQGGVLKGDGTVVGRLHNIGGSIEQGASAGSIMVDGDFTQDAGGTLVAEVGGYAPGTEYDQLIVTGTATLGGALTPVLIDAFQPLRCEPFRVVSAGTVVGDFAEAPDVDPNWYSYVQVDGVDAMWHELCPIDSDRNGSIDVLDLLAVLGNWGLPGAPDHDCSGSTDVGDLLAVLGAWGPCP